MCLQVVLKISKSTATIRNVNDVRYGVVYDPLYTALVNVIVFLRFRSYTVIANDHSLERPYFSVSITFKVVYGSFCPTWEVQILHNEFLRAIAATEN